MLLTYRYRVKNLNGLLNRQARAVNFVWNYCNDRQRDALRWERKWPTGFDLNRLTTGSSRELGLHSCTVNAVCEQYAKSRDQSSRRLLRFRGPRSLGWVPVKGRAVRETVEGFHFHGKEFRVFKSRSLPAGARIKDGSNFSRDTRGRWYINVCVEVTASTARSPLEGVGIDLGLKDLATLSTGEKVANRAFARVQGEALARAQRAGKKRLVRTIHARTRNSRHDHFHKATTDIVERFDYIAVGAVSASHLMKTRLAKSVLDAGWSSFRHMLRYKAIARGAWYEEVDEAYTTQVCSSCGSMPPERPKGIADLGVRTWVCSACGCEHDRDTNAARNLLSRSGHRAPAEGILGPGQGGCQVVYLGVEDEGGGHRKAFT